MATGVVASPLGAAGQRGCVQATGRRERGKSLQALHRFGWLIAKRVKGVRGKSKLVDRNATALEREPAEPPDRGTLVAIGIAVSQHQADAHRVVEGELWKFAGRGEDEVGIAGRQRAPKANVWTAGVTHGLCRRRAGEVDVVFDVVGGEILQRSTALVRHHDPVR